VLEAGCGVVVDPRSKHAATLIVETVRHWARYPEIASGLGKRARDAFITGFERQACCAGFEVVIRENALNGTMTGGMLR
jgi:hypothetical protein